MADDDKSSNDVQDDITAVLADDSQDSPAADPSPAKPEAKEAKADKVEDKKPEAKETKEEKQGDDTPAPPDVPTKDEGKAEKPAEETEDKPTKAEERKAQLKGDIDESKKALGIDPNTEIRDLVSARNALKAQVEKANAEVYQPATEDELTEQGMTSLEAKVEAMRQQQEMEKYNAQVADAQLTIESESQRVLQDFPIFNQDSQDYDKELAEEAAVLLESNLIVDPNTNQVIGSNVSPYQLYKTLARAREISTVKGQIQGQQATEKMLANADGGSSTAPPATAKDPVLEVLSSDEF